MSTNRDHFTTHGLHMNTRGKDWITNTWASIIKTLQTNSRTTPIIPLPEKINCIKNPHFPTSQNSKNTTTMKGEQEKERTTEVPYKEDVDDDPILQEDQAKKEDALPAKRTRRIPTTRHTDFLWLDTNVNQ